MGDSTETTIATQLCIYAISVLVPEPSCQVNRPGSSGTRSGTYSKSMPFWSNVAGQLGIGYLENCWPGDSFMNGHELNTGVEPAVWKTTPNAQLTLRGETHTLPRISFCPGEEARYTVSAQIPNSAGGMTSTSRTGGTAIRALSASELSEVTCPPVTNANGPIPWVVEYKQIVTTTSKIKPTLGEAIGTAMAYSAYIQVFFTALIVNMMLLGNCLKQVS